MYVYHPFSKRRQIALQKAINRKPKGHLSHCERWPFGKPLIVSEL